MRVLLDVRPTYQYVALMATALCLLAGCGDKQIQQSLPNPVPRISVEAPWKNRARIPRQYTCDGANVAPKLRATRPPGARDMAIVMLDPDAPGGTFVHWTRWGTNTQGKNSFGKSGYSGPCPPKGDKPHHYGITVYALRQPLRLPAGSEPEKVLQAIQKDAVASGSSTGIYSR